MRMSDGCSLAYRFDGEGSKPVLMFSNSLGFTHEMWDPQVSAMSEHFRILRYDNRGHGASDIPEGPLTIDRIARDAQEIIEGLKLHSVAYCGLSIGGMVGLWLAANVPHLLSRAVLANTSACLGYPHPLKPRLAQIEKGGMKIAVTDIVQRSLSDEFRKKGPVTTAGFFTMVENVPSAGYLAGGYALVDMDLRPLLSSIDLPVLVIVGTRDTATPAAMGEALAKAVGGARLAELDAAHLSNIEQTEMFNELIKDFLLET